VKSLNENGVAYRCSEEIDNVNLNLFKKELVDCEFASSKSYSQQELQYYGRTLTKESFEDVMNTAQQLEAVSIPSVSSFKHPYDQWKEQRMSSLAFVKNAECLTFNGAPGNHNLVQDFKKFMLLRVQNVYKLFGHQVSPEENVKVPKLQQRFNLCTQALAFDKFKELWMNAISQLDSLCVEDLAQLQTLMSIYLNLSQSIASAVKDFYCAITRLADLLINLNILIAKHGFCIPLVPEEEEEEDDKNEEGGTLDGTGMDAGEKGEKNVSDQIENQDQVEGLKDQEPQADDEEDLKNEDGIEMDVGMDNSKSFGEEEGPKEEEKEDEEQSEEEDLDDGMDDLDDQGEELDERMWNEQDQEAEKKDETVRDKSAQSSKEEEKETEAVTGENEYNEEQDKDSANDQPNEMEHDSDDNEQAGSQDELEEEEIDEEGAEGFKPRPVEDDETSEAENQNEEDHELDLNNMDLDDEGDSKEEFNEDENVVDMDEDENEEENVSDSPEDKNIEETAELNQEEDLPMDQDELNTKSTENDSYEQDIADEGHGGAAGGIDKEELEVDPSVESQQQNREQTNQNGLDSESQQNTQDSQSPDTQNGLPPKGSEFTEVLEYWKRNLDILQSSEDPTVNEQQKVQESTQFEFCEQEEDTVALCDSDKTAAPVVDQDKMDEDTKEESSKDADELQESMQNSSSTQRQASAPKESEMAVDDKLNQANEMDVDQEKVEKVEGVNADEFEKDQSSSAQDNLIIQNELLDEELNNALELETLKISESETYELMDAENAQKIWNLAERTTSVLASRLCEQLRVVLEPTKSSKLAGDFKTGKRLNIKKIIPFIASKYKKDKIWLRRVKPNVRQYQILLAVDDSKSMKESGCVSLAYKSLALVFKAFSQLEVGDIGVVKFGENVQSVYPFGKPLSSSYASEMIRQFTFKQNQTRIPELVQNCIDMLSSQQRQNPNIWQLCIIVSDGLCDDHEKIRRLLSSAAEKRIQILFMLLNHENEELVKIKNVTFVDGKLVMKDYMDSFPFEYYLIMKSIEKLPEALSQTIRQWFESVNR
jgi:midasin